MNTDIHALALLLQSMCWRLAVSQAAKSRTFEQMCTAALALDIAKQWRWDGDQAVKLVENLKQYYQCKDIPIEITLFSIVPHAADVERLFGEIQSVKCCNLTVRTFETLEKLHNNYSYHVHQHALAAGQPVRRKHAHMHTQNNDGIDTDLAMDLDSHGHLLW
ncbi:hypothetical protein BDR04DRAFT_1235428 [Suillus decipiens]|nr:hypothetical protein BDR04DRAFT_1235428 [Suillus decipiens]